MSDEEYNDNRRVIAPRGRRTEDLVGWRLGQLENGLDAVDRSVEELKKDFYARSAIEKTQVTERDWALRIILFLLTVVTTVSTVVNIFVHH